MNNPYLPPKVDEIVPEQRKLGGLLRLFLLCRFGAIGVELLRVATALLLGSLADSAGVPEDPVTLSSILWISSNVAMLFLVYFQSRLLVPIVVAYMCWDLYQQGSGVLHSALHFNGPISGAWIAIGVFHILWDTFWMWFFLFSSTARRFGRET